MQKTLNLGIGAFVAIFSIIVFSKCGTGDEPEVNLNPTWSKWLSVSSFTGPKLFETVDGISHFHYSPPEAGKRMPAGEITFANKSSDKHHTSGEFQFAGVGTELVGKLIYTLNGNEQAVNVNNKTATITGLNIPANGQVTLKLSFEFISPIEKGSGSTFAMGTMTLQLKKTTTDENGVILPNSGKLPEAVDIALLSVNS